MLHLCSNEVEREAFPTLACHATVVCKGKLCICCDGVAHVVPQLLKLVLGPHGLKASSRSSGWISRGCPVVAIDG